LVIFLGGLELELKKHNENVWASDP
jgi:hypothetical protein